MPNVWCLECNHRQASDEGVFHAGPYLCPRGHAMRARPEDVPPPPPGWHYFDHTFTPEEAAAIIDLIPEDSHHWRDISRKAPNAVEKYTALMHEGRWRDETLEHGFYEHPLRWDEEGRITHGVMRLLACRDSGRPFRACVLAPEGLAVAGCPLVRASLVDQLGGMVPVDLGVPPR